MIYKDEIDVAAKELRVNPADVQRDYVFGWLLSKIFGGSPLGGRLVLKGGNALRKAYFPNTRYSSDLDFVTDGAFAPEELKKQLMDVCDAVSAGCGVEFIQDKARVQEKSRLDKNLQVLEALTCPPVPSTYRASPRHRFEYSVGVDPNSELCGLLSL